MEHDNAFHFEGYEYDIFVVFADADREFVHSYLLPTLGWHQSRVLLFDDLAIGQARLSEIERGVSSSRFTLAVLSPAYLDDYLASFGEELASYISLKSVRIIPLILADCQLPLRIDARVTLDFTDRSGWASEVARLGDFLRASTSNTADSQLDLARSKMSGRLEIVDSSLDAADDDPRFEIIDIKVINRSFSTVIITRIEVTVSAIWHVCQPWLGYLKSSASYHLDIPARAPPFVLSKPVSHSLHFNEADRFQIVLSSTEFQSRSNLAFVMVSANIFYGPGDRVESTRDLLCAFAGHKQSWIDWTQPIAAARAFRVRTEGVHMSRRCVDLLESIEARGWADNIESLTQSAIIWTEIASELVDNGHLDSARYYLELAHDIRRLIVARIVGENHNKHDWRDELTASHELSAAHDRLVRLPQSTRQQECTWAGANQTIDFTEKVLRRTGGMTAKLDGRQHYFHDKGCSCERQVGYVFDEQGRPVSEASVSIADEHASSERDGQFEIHFSPDLPTAKRSLVVRAAGYEAWRGEPSSGSAPLQVRLSPSPPKLRGHASGLPTAPGGGVGASGTHTDRTPDRRQPNPSTSLGEWIELWGFRPK